MSRRAPLDRDRPDWLTARNEVQDDPDHDPTLGKNCRRRRIKRSADDCPDDDHADDQPDVDPWAVALGVRRR